MSDFKIHVNDTGEEEDNLLVIIIDNKHKTEASFALSRTEKNAGQIRLIKGALAKVKFLNDTGIEERKRIEAEAVVKKYDALQKAVNKREKAVVKPKKTLKK